MYQIIENYSRLKYYQKVEARFGSGGTLVNHRIQQGNTEYLCIAISLIQYYVTYGRISIIFQRYNHILQSRVIKLKNEYIFIFLQNFITIKEHQLYLTILECPCWMRHLDPSKYLDICRNSLAP